MKIVIAGIVLIFWTAQIFAVPCPVLKEEDLSSERVYALTQNPDCKIRSIKDLIFHLPVRFRDQYAMFYRSRSIQGPLRTDFKRPRVVLYNYVPAGQPRFMLAFNSGDSDQPGADSAEMVDINTSGGKDDLDVFKYRDLTFKNEVAELSSANPSRCKTCHGDPARPIYPGYPDWEGSFGSLHAAEPPRAEVDGLKEFNESIEGDTYSRYRMLGSTLQEGQLYATDKLAQGNDAINGILGIANAVRVARMVMKTPDYEKFKFAIAASFLRCSDIESFVPHALGQSLHKNIDSRFKLREKWPARKLSAAYNEMRSHKRTFLLPELSRTRVGPKVQPGGSLEMERLYVDTFKVQGLSRADPMGAMLRFLFEGRNLEIDNYFLDLMQPTYRYHDGGYAGEHTAIELSRHDPELNKLIGKHISIKEFGVPLIQDEKQICNSLKEKSLSATRGFKVAQRESATEAVICINCPQRGNDRLRDAVVNGAKYTEAAVAPGKHPFADKCASCHDSEIDYAPRIPFSDSAKFRAWLNSGENADKVRERLLHPDEEKRMPQNKRLSGDEIDKMIRYISVGK